MKRVDKRGDLRIIVLNDKVSRESDTVYGTTQAARYLHVNDGQRNGDADSLGKDFIQATVGRMIVLLLIALKAELFEQKLVGGVDELLAIGVRANTLA